MKELFNKCLSYSVTVNEHKSYYQTVKEYLEEQNNYCSILEDIDEDVLKEIYERNVLIEIHCYPNNSVGGYYVCHYDLDLAIQEMLNLLENER